MSIHVTFMLCYGINYNILAKVCFTGQQLRQLQYASDSSETIGKHNCFVGAMNLLTRKNGRKMILNAEIIKAQKVKNKY